MNPKRNEEIREKIPSILKEIKGRKRKKLIRSEDQNLPTSLHIAINESCNDNDTDFITFSDMFRELEVMRRDASLEKNSREAVDTIYQDAHGLDY